MNRFRMLLSKRAALILVIVLSMAVGVSLGTAFFDNETAYAVDQKAAASSGRAALYDLQNAFTSIVDEVLPSVVSITSKRTVETRTLVPWFDEDFFKDFPFSIPRPNVPEKQRTESYGSGVIVRSDGYILTNDHVVGGADEVVVTLKDGREFEGTVLRDPRGDLALVRIDAKNLPAVKLGDSSKVKVGSWAIAIGTPFGLDQTVTVGVVSAIGRHQSIADQGIQRSYTNLIQTDAAINLGNSGGPLVNIDGELIGINTLIRTPFGAGNVGIGFAIPVNTAKFVLDQLIAHGKVTRGRLGVIIEDLDPKSAERYGVEKGALVRSVEVGSPADEAGVQVEDVIVEFDGKKISSSDELVETVAATSPAKQVPMVVVRSKARETLNATVGEWAAVEPAETTKESSSKLGFAVAKITPQLAKKYQLEEDTSGVVVTNVNPGSTAMRRGIQPGLVITRVNNKPVKTVAQFNAETKDLKSGDTLRLVVQTKQHRTLVEFRID